MKQRLIILLVILFIAQFVQAQVRDTTVVKKHSLFNKKNLIVAAIAAQQIGSFYIEYKWWWEGNYHNFVLESDGWFNNYSDGLDKVGHFYMSYLYFNVLNEVMKWGEFSNKTRTITCIALPFAYALSIEIGDGFSTYNFSFPDLAANSLGICYGVLQDRVPYMRNFNVKFSYFPSQSRFDNHFQKWSLTEDYDGHIYWLTMNMHNMLPASVKKAWPAFLNLGVGYGTVNTFDAVNIQREFFLGLDYNLGAIHTNNKTVRAALNILDKFHYPAPGLKKTGGGNITPQWLILN